MDLLQPLLCAAIFALLGVRVGWSARLGLLLPLALAALGVAFLLTSHVFAAIGLALLLNVVAQLGFGLGILTNRTGVVPTALLAHRPDQLP